MTWDIETTWTHDGDLIIQLTNGHECRDGIIIRESELCKRFEEEVFEACKRLSVQRDKLNMDNERNMNRWHVADAIVQRFNRG